MPRAPISPTHRPTCATAVLPGDSERPLPAAPATFSPPPPPGALVLAGTEIVWLRGLCFAENGVVTLLLPFFLEPVLAPPPSPLSATGFGLASKSAAAAAAVAARRKDSPASSSSFRAARWVRSVSLLCDTIVRTESKEEGGEAENKVVL